MTKREREQVVELLRCAADMGLRGFACPLSAACFNLGFTLEMRVALLADCAIEEAQSEASKDDGSWYRYGEFCLEAAQRVEEGNWP